MRREQGPGDSHRESVHLIGGRSGRHVEDPPTGGHPEVGWILYSAFECGKPCSDPGAGPKCQSGVW